MIISTLNTLPECENLITVSAIFSQYIFNGFNTLGIDEANPIYDTNRVSWARMVGYEESIQKIRDVVLADLVKQAQDLEGDALIGVSFQYSELTHSGDKDTMVCGSATVMRKTNSVQKTNSV